MELASWKKELANWKTELASWKKQFASWKKELTNWKKPFASWKTELTSWNNPLANCTPQLASCSEPFASSIHYPDTFGDSNRPAHPKTAIAKLSAINPSALNQNPTRSSGNLFRERWVADDAGFPGSGQEFGEGALAGLVGSQGGDEGIAIERRHPRTSMLVVPHRHFDFRNSSHPCASGWT